MATLASRASAGMSSTPFCSSSRVCVSSRCMSCAARRMSSAVVAKCLVASATARANVARPMCRPPREALSPEPVGGLLQLLLRAAGAPPRRPPRRACLRRPRQAASSRTGRSRRARRPRPCGRAPGSSSAMRFSAASAPRSERCAEEVAGLLGHAADRLGDLRHALLGGADRLADAARGAAGRLLGDAAEALAEAEQLGGEGGDLLLRGRQRLRSARRSPAASSPRCGRARCWRPWSSAPRPCRASRTAA